MEEKSDGAANRKRTRIAELRPFTKFVNCEFIALNKGKCCGMQTRLLI